jgi:hypothetical protein
MIRRMIPRLAFLLPLAAGCGSQPAPATPSSSPSTSTHTSEPTTVVVPAPTAATRFAVTSLALPGAADYGVLMDYIVFDPRTRAVWVPAGNTAAVDVIDIATRHVAQVAGFPTQEIERRGQKRTIGPSAAALGGAGTVYVVNRGDSSVCAVDEAKLVRGACGKLDATPDGIAYVAKTHEVWVTTPRDKSIRILDATTLAQKDKVTFDGGPEGFAVDATRNRFYTNLEDKDTTLAIDLTSHATVATWKANCGEEGPRGLRMAEAEGFLIVACTAKIETLDVGHDGAVVGSVDTGEGVDDFDYIPANHTIYVGAGRAARLTIASLDPKGALTSIISVPTKQGARNPAVASDGSVYLPNSQGGEVVVVAPER